MKNTGLLRHSPGTAVQRYGHMLMACTLVLAGTLTARAGTTAEGSEPTESPMALGPESAPVTIAVFSDFRCPFSATEFFLLEQLHRSYPRDVEIVWKQSPLDIHADAEEAHRAALAAGRQGKFLQMAELLYANQDTSSKAQYDGYARRLGLNAVEFQHDMHSPAVDAALRADETEARALGIDQTPTMFVNGERLNGTQSVSKLSAIIDKTRSAREAAALHAGAPASPLANAAPPVDDGLGKALAADPSAARGRAGAPLTIVEFTDFQCPYCRAAAGPLEQFAAAHPDEVRVVYRAFPLEMHAHAEFAAEAALAAGSQGKFWPMHDLLFANQRALTAEDIHGYAAQLGLNLPAFDQALQTHHFASDVAYDRALGMRAEVEGTPTFFVDGQRVNGAPTLPEWNQLLQQHTAGKQEAVLVRPAGAVNESTADVRVVLGSKDAPERVVWFTDVRSRTAAAQAVAVRQLVQQGNGRVQVAVKVAPLPVHADGVLASEALLAAYSMGKFWEMYDALASRPEPLDDPSLLTLAAALRLDTAAFSRQLELSRRQVRADQDEAQERGILGTPVLFVGRQRFDGLQTEAVRAALQPVAAK